MKQFSNEIMKTKAIRHQLVLCVCFFIVTLTVCSANSSFAQTITKSFPDKVASRFSDYEIIGKNDLGIVVHYFGNNESELVTYDDKLRIANRRDRPFL